MAGHIQAALRGALQSWDDAPIQRLLLQGVQNTLGQLDTRPALANLLASLMHQGRHQALLDQTLGQLAAYLAQPHIHSHFAHSLAQWLQREYPKLQMVLPTEKLGKKGADLLTKLLQDFFTDIQNDPRHFVRLEIHAMLRALVLSSDSLPVLRAWVAGAGRDDLAAWRSLARSREADAATVAAAEARCRVLDHRFGA